MKEVSNVERTPGVSQGSHYPRIDPSVSPKNGYGLVYDEATGLWKPEVVKPEIAPESITNEKIALKTITANRLVSGTLTSGQIAVRGIEEGSLANESVSRRCISNSSINAEKILNESVTEAKLLKYTGVWKTLEVLYVGWESTGCEARYEQFEQIVRLRGKFTRASGSEEYTGNHVVAKLEQTISNKVEQMLFTNTGVRVLITITEKKEIYLNPASGLVASEYIYLDGLTFPVIG